MSRGGNNSAAACSGALLTLGLPNRRQHQQLELSSWVAAGTLLFANQPDLVWGLIASLYIGNAMLLILNLPLVGIWVRLLSIPRPLLYGGILVFATLGTYSLSNSVVDLIALYVIGFVGFLMRRHGFPVAPAVIGMILGPMESAVPQALASARGLPFSYAAGR